MANQHTPFTDEHKHLIESKIAGLIQGIPFCMKELDDAIPMGKSSIRRYIDNVAASMNVKLVRVWADDNAKEVSIKGDVSPEWKRQKAKKSANNPKYKYMCRILLDGEHEPLWVSVRATSKETAPEEAKKMMTTKVIKDEEEVITCNLERVISVLTPAEYSQTRIKHSYSSKRSQLGGNPMSQKMGKNYVK